MPRDALGSPVVRHSGVSQETAVTIQSYRAGHAWTPKSCQHMHALLRCIKTAQRTALRRNAFRKPQIIRASPMKDRGAPYCRLRCAHCDPQRRLTVPSKWPRITAMKTMLTAPPRWYDMNIVGVSKKPSRLYETVVVRKALSASRQYVDDTAG